MKEIHKAGSEVEGLINAAIDQWHRELAEARVRIGAVFVAVSDPLEIAIKVHGAKCLARIRRLNARDRLMMDLEALMEIDAGAWHGMDQPARLALLDHELTHVEVSMTRNGFSETSDGRPKIWLRPDDWTLTGFVEVIKRHGSVAHEHAALKTLVCEQLAFAFELTETKRPRLAKQA